jgi:lipoate-protein ligase A
MGEPSGDPRMDGWRLIDLTYDGGATQLAVSEAVLDAVRSGQAPPTLRFYSWSEPVVILGVGQSSADIDLTACEALGYCVLRRISGGTAVYHDADELSFEITVPAGHLLGPFDVRLAYARFAEILSDALVPIGVATRAVEADEATTRSPDEQLRPACFAALSPYELLASGRKLIGMAQVRRGGVIIQHGAVYRYFDAAKLARVLAASTLELKECRRTALADRVVDLETAASRAVELREVADAIRAAVVHATGQSVEAGALSGAEREAADRLARDKYASPEWTFRR